MGLACVPRARTALRLVYFSCLPDTIILVTGKKLSSSTEKSGRETPKTVLRSKVPTLGDHAWMVSRIMKAAGRGIHHLA